MRGEFEYCSIARRDAGMMGWRERLNNSNRAFLALVWPVIKEWCGGGEIRPVEIMTDPISRDLDILCGIDVWQTISDRGCRGIASRIQFGPRCWRTFTIRKDRDTGARTEYEKRIEAIRSRGALIYPYLTCQAYINKAGGLLLGGAIARTEDIFRAITLHTLTRRTTDASFYVVRFEDVVGAWEFWGAPC